MKKVVSVMDQPMGIDFECGVSVDNVGMLTMALNHHLTICEDDACQQDVRQELTKL